MRSICSKTDINADLSGAAIRDPSVNQPMDRRRERTRSSIIQAFNELFRDSRLEDIKVPDVIRSANVGRSTFYEHFSNVEEVYLTAFSRPLSILADGLAGNGNRDDLEELLKHLWSNRHQARSAFNGRRRDRLNKMLLELVSERIMSHEREVRTQDFLETIKQCEGAMGLIRAWLVNDINCTLTDISAAITNSVTQIEGKIEETKSFRAIFHDP